MCVNINPRFPVCSLGIYVYIRISVKLLRDDVSQRIKSEDEHLKNGGFKPYQEPLSVFFVFPFHPPSQDDPDINLLFLIPFPLGLFHFLTNYAYVSPYFSRARSLRWLKNPRHSHDLPWSAPLSVDCRAANFNFTPLLSDPEINASFEKWKSNCLHRGDEWRWLRTNYLAPGSTSVWLLFLATPVFFFFFFTQASWLSYCFSAQGRSSAAAWEI